MRALAVTGSERSPQLPNVPSMAEAGVPEVNTKLWSGFFAPAKTPPAIAAKLEAALRKAITDPGVSAKLREMAVTPGGTASADFRKMIDADIQNYVAVVKAANLKFELARPRKTAAGRAGGGEVLVNPSRLNPAARA